MLQNRRTLILLASLVLLIASSARADVAALDGYGSFLHTVPVMTNSPGQNGAFFKTRVSIVNPTFLSFPIIATLYGPNGQVGKATININSAQQRTWDNFLQEVFGYTGAGTVKFDSFIEPPSGNQNYVFLVSAEVYTESPSGRYKTVVCTGQGLFPASSKCASYGIGISVSATTRTNMGFFNDSSSSVNVATEVRNENGEVVGVINTVVPARSWTQVPINTPVSNGYVKWGFSSNQRVYAYVVTVDNTSNDGTFIASTDRDVCF